MRKCQVPVLIVVLAFSQRVCPQSIAGASDVNPAPDRFMTIEQYVRERNPSASETAIQSMVGQKAQNILDLVSQTKADLITLKAINIALGVLIEPELLPAPYSLIPDECNEIAKALCEATFWLDSGGDSVRAGMAIPGRKGIGLSETAWCTEPGPRSRPLVTHEGSHLVTFPGWDQERSDQYDKPTVIGEIACSITKVSDEVISLRAEKVLLEFLRDSLSLAEFDTEEYCLALEDLASGANSYVLQSKGNTLRALAQALSPLNTSSDRAAMWSEVHISVKTTAALKELVEWIRMCAFDNGCW